MGKHIYNSSDFVKNLYILSHYEKMNKKAYEKGYLAEGQIGGPPIAENPYPFPKNISDQQLLISSTKGKLSKTAKKKLIFFGNKFEKTNWSLWENGNFFRYYVEPYLN